MTLEQRIYDICRNKEVRWITMEEWMNTDIWPDFPRNRDASARASNNKKTHLRGTPIIMMQLEFKAVRFRGELSKIDGHCRPESVRQGRMVFNTLIEVTIYDIGDDEELLNATYEAFDSPLSVESTAERAGFVKGKAGFFPKSVLLQSNTFKGALEVLGFKGDKYQAGVEYFLEELNIIDNWDISEVRNKKWAQCVIAFAIHSLKENRDKATSFFKDYRQDKPEHPLVDAILSAMLGADHNTGKLIKNNFIHINALFAAYNLQGVDNE
ncbi:MAG: hypothetical protein ACRC6V_19415 [Bacteroidales bacterium]